MKKILIIGKGGQVSENLIALLSKKEDYEFLAIGQAEIDLSHPQEVYPKLKALEFKPDVIINAAAYTAVDLAEDEQEKCDNINHLSVIEIARYATKIQALLIHYSTDYVYDGSGNKPFEEGNVIELKPLNHYGKTKLAGEKEVLTSGCRCLVLRTSWVYNHVGKNFVLTMLKLAAEREELKVVSDQIGSPTYAYDIADITIQMISQDKKRYGIYHIVPEKNISWYDFASLIVKKAHELSFPVMVKNVLPIYTSEYPTKAKRPYNSRLSTAKLKKDFGLQFPDIEESLTNCLKRIRDNN